MSIISQTFNGETSNVVIENQVTIYGNISDVLGDDSRRMYKGKFDFIW